MARPTAPKFLKLQTDLDKLAARLVKEASAITSVRGNPMGSDMRVCKDLGPVEDAIREAAGAVREAQRQLEKPLAILVNRQKSKG